MTTPPTDEQGPRTFEQAAFKPVKLTIGEVVCLEQDGSILVLEHGVAEQIGAALAQPASPPPSVWLPIVDAARQLYCVGYSQLGTFNEAFNKAADELHVALSALPPPPEGCDHE